MNKETLFEVKDVKVWFPIRKGFPKKTVGYVKAVDGVSLRQERQLLLHPPTRGCSRSYR